jgi:hypothetical protein
LKVSVSVPDCGPPQTATAQPGAGVKLTGAVIDWRAVRLPPVMVAVPR